MNRRLPHALLAIVACAAAATLRAGPASAFVPPNERLRRAHGEMVLVPGATFRFSAEATWIGGTSSGGGDPAGYEVRLAGFYIDRLEVTAASYKACVSAHVCPPLLDGDTFTGTHTPICTYEKPGFEQHPINCVNHDEARRYCEWVGKRLPIEPEFELAERGTSGRPFPWGSALPTASLVNACDDRCAREGSQIGDSFTSMYDSSGGGDDGWAFTAPVGTYPDGASPYGALDLSGNVEEWVADPYYEINGPYVPPSTTPSPDAEYVIRGGSWDLDTADAFATVRRTEGGDITRAAWLGFRCAKDE